MLSEQLNINSIKPVQTSIPVFSVFFGFETAFIKNLSFYHFDGLFQLTVFQQLNEVNTFA